MVEAEIGLAEQPVEPPLFQPRIVGVVEVVDAHHHVPAVEQQLGDLRADESRTAGDEVAIGHGDESGMMKYLVSPTWVEPEDDHRPIAVTMVTPCPPSRLASDECLTFFRLIGTRGKLRLQVVADGRPATPASVVRFDRGGRIAVRCGVQAVVAHFRFSRPIEMSTERRIKWSEVRQLQGTHETFFMIAERDGDAWRVFERSTDEVSWYPVEPTPAVIERIQKELARRRGPGGESM